MVLLALICFVVILAGYSLSPTVLIRNGFHYAFGLMGTLIFLNYSSSMSGKAVSSLFIWFTLLLLFIFIFRNYRGSITEKSIRISIDLGIVIVFLSICRFVVARLNFDYASQNFDAYYAIQDGDWLADHAANSTSKFDWDNVHSSLMPLNWSSSIRDRYGVSYLLAPISKILGLEAWNLAQYLGFVLILLYYFTLFKYLQLVLKDGFQKSWVAAAVFLAAISPFAILQIQYFMFGQMMALPVFILFLYLLADLSLFKFAFLVPPYFYITYPAFFFVSFLLLILVGILNYIRFKEKSERNLYFYLKTLALSVLLLFFTYGSHFKDTFARLTIWLVTNVSSDFQNSWKSITIFSQFGTKLIGGLLIGIIPYPYQKNSVSTVYLVFIYTLFALFLIQITNIFRNTVMEKYKLSLICTFIVFAIVIAKAFMGNQPYVVFKVNSWIQPILFSLLACQVIYFIIGFKSRLSWFRKLTVIGSILILLLNLATANIYMSRSKTWTNFPGILKPDSYSNFKEINSSAKIIISAPTSEESIWIAAHLTKQLKNKSETINQGAQALGVGMTTTCDYPNATLLKSKNYSILQSRNLVDITQPLLRTKPSQSFKGNYELIDKDSIISGIVIVGSGTFPPFSTANYPELHLNKSSKARWSSNQLCGLVFSKINGSVNFTLPIINGPDLVTDSAWKVYPHGSIKEIYENEISFLKVQIKVIPGWNIFQIKNESCFKRPFRSKGAIIPDDRVLCFLAGEIRLY